MRGGEKGERKAREGEGVLNWMRRPRLITNIGYISFFLLFLIPSLPSSFSSLFLLFLLPSLPSSFSSFFLRSRIGCVTVRLSCGRNRCDSTLTENGRTRRCGTILYPFIHLLYTFYTPALPCIHLCTPVIPCIYTIYTPNTPLNTLNTPFIRPLYA